MLQNIVLYLKFERVQNDTKLGFAKVHGVCLNMIYHILQQS